MLMQTALATLTKSAISRDRSPEIIRRAAAPRTGSFSLMTLYAGWVRLTQGKAKARAATPRASMLPSAV